VKKLILALIVLAALLQGWDRWQHRPIDQPAGILAADEPQQSPLSGAPWRFKDYTLSPLAAYEIRARVLSTERYSADNMADLVPVDVAVGWGVMSDTAFLQSLEISQSGRFFWVAWEDASRDSNPIMHHAANMHLIPANDLVKKQIKALRVGQVVTLRGKLVKAERPDGWSFTSSLVRTDTGDGACELLWVERLL
jgi:hypothetical protein